MRVDELSVSQALDRREGESKSVSAVSTPPNRRRSLDAAPPAPEPMEDLFVDVTSATALGREKRWAIGILCVVLVAVIWAGASVLVQYIFEDLSFEKPFFLTYVCNSLFALNLPVWYIMLRLGYVSDVPNGVQVLIGEYVNITRGSPVSNGERKSSDLQDVTEEDEERLRVGSGGGEGRARARAERYQHGMQQTNRRRRQTQEVLVDEKEEGTPASSSSSARGGGGGAEAAAARTKVEIARISLIICPLWFLANWTYNLSLAMTSVTSSTVISNTATLWVFLLSVCVLGERFHWLKLAGVAACVLGNALTTVHDTDKNGPAETAWGDIVCTFSAFMYGVYTVNIRRLIPDEAAVPLPLFFGFLGLINMIMLAPIVVILHYTGQENLSTLSGETFALICAKGLIDNVISDYLWALSVLLTTPTVATIGLSLTIPLAILSDLMLHNIFPTMSSTAAAVFVIIGFMTINLASNEQAAELANNNNNIVAMRDVNDPASPSLLEEEHRL